MKQISGGQGLGVGVVWQWRTTKELLEMIEMFYTRIEVIVTQLYTFGKIIKFTQIWWI